MIPDLDVSSEPIADVPLLMHWLSRMNIASTIDRAVARPHGNRRGLSVGHLAHVFLAYILSQGNHALSPVRDWVRERHDSLERLLGTTISDTDFTDDRLEDMLDAVGPVSVGAAVDLAVGSDLIRAYDLPTDTARLDTTTASVYHSPEGESLLKFGYSKDHRPDLRQFKLMLATLDPVGIPLVATCVDGASADDPLYVPAWRAIRAVLGRSEFLAVGDTKMASLETRASIEQEGGWYLTPLPATGLTPELLRHLVKDAPDPLTSIRLPTAPPDAPPIGVGYETDTIRTWTDPTTTGQVQWKERIFVVRSDTHADSEQRGLQGRLSKAEAALAGQRAPARLERAEVEARSASIVAQYRVEPYLEVVWHEEVTQQKRYLRRGRHTPDTPCEIVAQRAWRLQVQRREEAIELAQGLAGWRLYVTNAPAARLDLVGAVSSYRQQWQPEHAFARLKGGSLAIRPLLLRSDTRIRGLMVLLVLALRALTLIEFVARRTLTDSKETVAGLYPGNPTRTTARPTTERLLKIFALVMLYRLNDGVHVHRQLSPLSSLQQRILTLLDLPTSIYTDLALPPLDSS